MRIDDVKKIINRTSVVNNVPISLKHLTEEKFILYKGFKLKTDFLLDIVNTLISKSNKCMRLYEKVMKGFPINSRILIKNYSNNYKKYIDYLIDNSIIIVTKNHTRGKNAINYRINLNLLYEKHFYYYNTNKKILKNKRDRDIRQILEKNSSSIELEIRPHLYADLSRFRIDMFESKLVIDRLFENDHINKIKKDINTYMCEMINIENFDFTFDKHGRFHTNYTRLRTEIRQKALRVSYNNKLEDVVEIDIKNSQPMFLLLLLRDNLTDGVLKIKDFLDYKKECYTGDIYKRLIKMYSFCYPNKTLNRKEAKKIFYKYLFGPVKNNDVRKMFKMMFPSIDKWLTLYKKEKGYKTVSHALQRLESDLIYNDIIKEIKSIKNVPIITIHDSLIVPKSEKDLVEEVFYKHVNKIFLDVYESNLVKT